MANITKEFLESAIGKAIESFELNSGSNLGDGYTSLLYSIDVKLVGEKDIRHLLLKCYPVHPARQEWLTNSNIFQKELSVYNKLIPALIEFQTEGNNPGAKVIQPPFPELIYGQAIDYTGLLESDSKLCPDPLSNCIIMPDLRKTSGFRLANRLVGYDLDHSKLVIMGQAKFHALSWAYKLKCGIPSLTQKFPFLNTGTFYDDMDDAMMGAMFDNSLSLFKGVVEACAKGEEEKERLLKSLERARGTVMDVAGLYFCDKKSPKDPSTTKDNVIRVAGASKENEEPWLTATHGDSWLNNQMFRYDETTGKPLETIFVDLQLTRQGDPMTDLVYSIYTSTTSEFRRKHLTDLHKLYIQTFIQVCEHFKVMPYPGLDLAEFQRRFHRAKAFGFLMAFMCFPLFLSDPKDAVDLDQLSDTYDQNDLVKGFTEMTGGVVGSTRFQTRVMDLVRELHAEGII